MEKYTLINADTGKEEKMTESEIFKEIDKKRVKGEWSDITNWRELIYFFTNYILKERGI